MKKVLFIVALPMALLFQSCTKDEIETINVVSKNNKKMEAVKEFQRESPNVIIKPPHEP